MNRQDITIVVILSALLLGWLFHSNKVAKQQLEAAREQALQQQTNEVARALSSEAAATAELGRGTDSAVSTEDDATAAARSTPATTLAESADDEATDLPEQSYRLSNEFVNITLSSKGATLKEAVLPRYRATVERDSDPVRLEFKPAAALALRDLAGMGSQADFTLVAEDDSSVTLERVSGGLKLTRKIALGERYKLEVSDSFSNAGGDPLLLPELGVGLGAMHKGLSKNDTLGVDSLAALADGEKKYGKVRHWDTKLNGLFTGGRGGGGCSGPPSGDGLPLKASTEVPGEQEWVAVKSRFFLQAFSSDSTNNGYRIDVERLDEPGALKLKYATAQVRFPAATLAAGEVVTRNYNIYVGPKKLDLVKGFGPKGMDMMQFGFFKWMCVLLLPILNFFYLLIPNYGVAVILLTMLVRIAFWPLTHKSTASMKKMQEIQPKLKELQKQFKDDPQKMQQETWKIYRENKVNPMASCLPMLIQIPVFIALFTVLRSAVELRFAPFLWIADLSEPENLLAGMLPIVPALNILPFLMAGTMLLQSRLTPAMGDPAQQKMMMWMMPAMMLFMFYQMPSALVLYWTVSQILAIVQLYWQRRKSAERDGGGPTDDGRPVSRQVRRQLERQAKAQQA